LSLVVLAAGCGGGVFIPGEVDAGDCQPIAGPDIRRQGVLEATGVETDLALGGPGFFVIDRSDATRLYTRAGSFTTDRDGYLVNLESMRVIGFPADEHGELSATPGHLLLGRAVMLPRPTTRAWVRGNLNADTPVSVIAFDPSAPMESSAARVSGVLYDGLGVEHDVQVYFQKTATDIWDFHVITDGGGLTGGTFGTPTEIAEGTLTFDAGGRLVFLIQCSNFNPVGAANPQYLELDMGDLVSLGGTGVKGVTQVDGQSKFRFGQNGHPRGLLTRTRVDSTGAVVGSFSNGQERSLGRVAVALFPAPVWLSAHGANFFSPTERSGVAELGLGCEGLRGCIQAGFVEALSNTASTCAP